MLEEPIHFQGLDDILGETSQPLLRRGKTWDSTLVPSEMLITDAKLESNSVSRMIKAPVQIRIPKLMQKELSDYEAHTPKARAEAAFGETIPVDGIDPEEEKCEDSFDI